MVLGQSPSSASQHLAVLRRSGLATAHRRGREVLYLRTPLATSLLAGGSEIGDRSA
jgi:DNA-binding transcriptional ArsR family regulator